MQRNGCFNNSKCSTNLDHPIDMTIPLPVLIRQMLDKAFGKSKRTIEVTEDRCTFKNKNYKTDLSLISSKDKSLHNETKDCSSLHESVSDYTKHKNNQLITIEEENTNSLHYLDNIDFTGIYLNRLLKSSDKSDDQIDRDDSLPPRSDIETCASQIDTDISINNSSCSTDFTNFSESSISQQNNDDKNESINTAHSFNDIDVSTNDENTADFLNIIKVVNSPETEQVSCESLSSLQEDKIESSFDASLVDVNFSSKGASKFISPLSLNKRRSKASSKLLKTPCYNASLGKKQYRTSFYITVKNTSKTAETTKISKVYPNRVKPFKSFEIHKQGQMAKPELIFTPATPEKDLKFC